MTWLLVVMGISSIVTVSSAQMFDKIMVGVRYDTKAAATYICAAATDISNDTCAAATDILICVESNLKANLSPCILEPHYSNLTTLGGRVGASSVGSSWLQEN